MYLDKHIKKTNPCVETVKAYPYSFHAGIFAYQLKRADENMDAALILKCYPYGIGKHSVCIDAATAAVLQTVCRGEPRTPYLFFTKRKGTLKRNKINTSRMSNILQKERTKLNLTTKQK